MNLALANTIYAGGPGSGCNPGAGKCGRPKDLSQKAIKEEVGRLTPLLEKVGKVWKKRIRQLDPKAEVKISVSPTGLFHYKKAGSPGVLESTWGLNLYVNGKDGTGRHFGIGFGLFPEPDGNAIKIQDSGLPDTWQGKGVFSAGLEYIVNNKEFRLNKVMDVHVDTNPKVWHRLARKYGFKYDG